MSDMQRPPVPSGGQMPPAGGNAIRDNLSVANPTDAAYMNQSGMVSKDMPMKDYLETVYKLPITSPVSAFAQAMAKQVKGRSPMGKMQAMAGNTGRPPAVERSMPPTGGQPPVGGGSSGGLDSLMAKLGG